MSRIVIEGVRKTFSKDSIALDGVDLDIGAGELLVLLGPSGCGKTTMLRSVAGLESPNEGRITIGDTVVFDASRKLDRRPERRDVGMVFQNYALWPHMTVERNIAYPLRARRMRTERLNGAVEDVAELVGCGSLLGRYPAQLSGGQQQRVALARALVAEPAVVLFDEPLSNLDAKLRRELRTEIRRLHRRVGFTGIYVTHDQSEALAIGDRIALLSAGRLIQVDRPEVVFRRPKSDWAAGFMGLSNRLEIEGRTGGWWFGGHRVDGLTELPGESTRVIRARPTGCRIAEPGVEPEPGAVVLRGGRVDLSTFAGEWLETDVDFDGHLVHVQESSVAWGPTSLEHRQGEQVDVVLTELSMIDFGGTDPVRGQESGHQEGSARNDLLPAGEQHRQSSAIGQRGAPSDAENHQQKETSR